MHKHQCLKEKHYKFIILEALGCLHLFPKKLLFVTSRNFETKLGFNLSEKMAFLKL